MAGAVLITFGLIQGLTEFLPISSSGHLVIVGQFFNQPGQQLANSVLVNIGTWLALVWATRQQLLGLIRQVWAGDWALPGKIGLATLPAGLAGWLLAGWLDGLSDQLLVVVIMLVGVGILMLIMPRPPAPVPAKAAPEVDFGQRVSWRMALGIGGLQAVALIPGTSRAGVTIIGGLLAGLTPDLAARWSFLMAIPVTLGAILRVIVSSAGWDQLTSNWPLLLAANLVSFAVGLLAVSWLLAILSRRSLRPFGWYRIGLGLFLLTLLATNVL